MSNTTYDELSPEDTIANALDGIARLTQLIDDTVDQLDHRPTRLAIERRIIKLNVHTKFVSETISRYKRFKANRSL